MEVCEFRIGGQESIGPSRCPAGLEAFVAEAYGETSSRTRVST